MSVLQRIDISNILVLNSHFSNKLKFPDDAFGGSEGREIIEEYHEDEVKAWRRKHAESVRRQKQNEAAERTKQPEEAIDVFDLLDQHEMMEELANDLESMEISDDDKLQKILSGELKVPESIHRIARNIGSQEKPDDEVENTHQVNSSEELDEEKGSVTSDSNNNDLIAQSNQEIVDLLKTYRSKIKDVLRNVKKDDERSINLFLDLIELKDDIEDDIRKLNEDGSVDESESDEKDSDDDTVSVEVTPKGTKRKVTFSTSLEDVKLIESKEQYKEAQSENNTIQIEFTHSEAKFNCQESSDEIIAHPGEIHKMFNKSALAPIVITKSILKKPGDLNSPTTPEVVKPVEKVFQSDVQVIGDVMEHKKELIFNDDLIQIASKSDTPKKVSKFKQMRLKS